ncbi:MAG: HAMP domain-containing sensor histidine kinase [Planctomycetaceae bacterium]
MCDGTGTVISTIRVLVRNGRYLRSTAQRLTYRASEDAPLEAADQLNFEMSNQMAPPQVRGNAYASPVHRHREIGRFLRELAHELGNIGFPLRLAIELQKRMGQVDETDLQGVLENQVNSLQEIIRRVQTVGRCLSNDMQTVIETLHARDIASDVITNLAEDVRHRSHALKLDDSTGEGAQITGDRELLVLALAELMKNAVRFTLPGGSIELKLKCTAEQVDFVVRDNGPGIPDELASRVFDPFVSSRSRLSFRNGEIGCGLTIAREVVSAHNGTIELRKTSKAGCEFVMALPRRSSQAH